MWCREESTRNGAPFTFERPSQSEVLDDDLAPDNAGSRGQPAYAITGEVQEKSQKTTWSPRVVALSTVVTMAGSAIR